MPSGPLGLESLLAAKTRELRKDMETWILQESDCGEIRGHTYDWVIYDEAQDRAYTNNRDFDKERIRREFEDLLYNRTSTSYKPKYNSTPIPPPPFAYLISFIGGPWNGQQKYLEREKHLGGQEILDNSHRYFAMPGQMNFRPASEPPDAVFEKSCYRFVVIPTNETPFSDIPCVIAIFQG